MSYRKYPSCWRTPNTVLFISLVFRGKAFNLTDSSSTQMKTFASSHRERNLSFYLSGQCKFRPAFYDGLSVCRSRPFPVIFTGDFYSPTKTLSELSPRERKAWSSCVSVRRLRFRPSEFESGRRTFTSITSVAPELHESPTHSPPFIWLNSKIRLSD